MANRAQLPYLIQLLDDDSEATRAALTKQFSHFGGDISDDIASLQVDLSPDDRFRLSGMLHPARRTTLIHEWIVPANLNDDWQSFEHLLRLLCDFMHDGITLRPSLIDSLDVLAQDIDERIPDISVNKLRKYLFADHLFTGARTNYYSIQHSDICYTLDTGKGNPLTLCVLFQLVAHRLKLDVTASNYPGHFLSRITLGGVPHLVDCYNGGRLIEINELLDGHKELSPEAKFSIQAPAPPRVIIHRILRNMEHSFSLNKQTEDALLMQKLQATMVN